MCHFIDPGRLPQFLVQRGRVVAPGHVVVVLALDVGGARRPGRAAGPRVGVLGQRLQRREALGREERVEGRVRLERVEGGEGRVHFAFARRGEQLGGERHAGAVDAVRGHGVRRLASAPSARISLMRLFKLRAFKLISRAGLGTRRETRLDAGGRKSN